MKKDFIVQQNAFNITNNIADLTALKATAEVHAPAGLLGPLTKVPLCITARYSSSTFGTQSALFITNLINLNTG